MKLTDLNSPHLMVSIGDMKIGYSSRGAWMIFSSNQMKEKGYVIRGKWAGQKTF